MVDEHYGQKSALINIGGAGSPRWKWAEERGNHEDNPFVNRAEKYFLVPNVDKLPPTFIGDQDLSHMTNWLKCLRTRKAPNATRWNGFAHSVVVIMAARPYLEGKKLYWNPKAQQFVNQPV